MTYKEFKKQAVLDAATSFIPTIDATVVGSSLPVPSTSYPLVPGGNPPAVTNPTGGALVPKMPGIKPLGPTLWPFIPGEFGYGEVQEKDPDTGVYHPYGTVKHYDPNMSASDKLQLANEKIGDAYKQERGLWSTLMDYNSDFMKETGWSPLSFAIAPWSGGIVSWDRKNGFDVHNPKNFWKVFTPSFWKDHHVSRGTFENTEGTASQAGHQKALNSEGVQQAIQSFVANTNADDLVEYAKAFGDKSKNTALDVTQKSIIDKASPMMVQHGWDLLKQDPLTNLPKIISAFLHMKGMPGAANFIGNPIAFYSLLAMTVLGGMSMMTGAKDDEAVDERRYRKYMKRHPYE